MPYSKTFCPYPWIHVMTQPSSTVNFCCVAQGQIRRDDGRVFYMKYVDKLEDVWNNKHYRMIRKQMIDGEEVEGCKPCYDLEKVGIPSYRENYIRDWMGWHPEAENVKARIEKSIKNDYYVEETPMYLDFRLGTLCNLRCRMCQSQNSSAIYKEMNDPDVYTDEERQFIIDKTHWGDFSDYTFPWYDSPRFLDAVEKWLPNVNRLYFTGGEPTIIQRVYWILEKCVELGIAKNIDLVFNSNMTNVQQKFLDICSEFKHVLMCVSVDGYGKVNEYIRGGSTWSVVDKHIREYATSDVVGELIFSPVVQTYNLLNITDLVDYAEEIYKISGRRVNISFIMNNYPECLDVKNLPSAVRKEAQEKLMTWMNDSDYIKGDEDALNTIVGLINSLDDEHARVDAEEQMKVFQQYTDLLDSKRDQDISKSLPDLWRHIKWR